VATFARPEVEKLIAAAVAQAERPLAVSSRGRLIIRSISEKPKPRPKTKDWLASPRRTASSYNLQRNNIDTPTHQPGLIRNRQSAVLVVIGIGGVAGTTLGRMFFPVPHQYLLAFTTAFFVVRTSVVGVPFGSLRVSVLVFIYRYFRNTQGKERILIAGCCPLISLNPFKYLVSIDSGNPRREQPARFSPI
jgi:hypothetical protein